MTKLWEWPDLNILLAGMKVPAGYRGEQLRTADVSRLIAKLRDWYPDIQVGNESRHLQEDFYRSSTQLIENEDDSRIYPIVFKQGDEICGMMTLEKSPQALTLSSPMGAIAYEHRGSGLVYLGPGLLEAFGRQMNAGLVYYYATLKVPQQQIMAEKLGFRPVGIVPAFDLDMISPGNVKRVYEIIYAKVLAPESEICTPDPKNLTPRTLKLFKSIFAES